MKQRFNPRAALDYRVLRAEGVLLTGGMPTQHGQIALANDTLFAQGNVDIELTNYAVGWRDPSDLEAELNFLFPPVQVTDRFSYRSFVNAEEFLLDEEDTDLRSIGGDFGFVEQYHNTESESRTLNKGLAIRIDHDQVKNQSNWRERAVGRLRSRLLRLDLRRAVALATAAAVNSPVVWDKATGAPGVLTADPDMDINDNKSSAADISGISPNRLYIGETAWNYRWAAYRSQNNAGGYASAAQTPDMVGATLGFQRTLKSQSRYQSAAAAKSQFLGNKVMMFLGDDGLGQEDPSNFKNFWSPCVDGQRFRVWTMELMKFTIFVVEHYSRPTVTSTLGIRQLTAANA
jgi:hypothetical protein